ncbi:MAG: hypothetical protein HY649_07875 [Acidobacteria bacterium]|nr:hypothetical protein [Acidobacteriota bacterium]
MMQWKPIVAVGASSGLLALAISYFAMGGAAGHTASAETEQASAEKNPFFSRLSAARRIEMGTVETGSKIHIRLVDAVSSERDTTGKNFVATLDRPLMVNDKMLAPAGSTVVGQLTNVKDAGHVSGRASLTMVLRKLVVNDKEYDLKTQPLTFVARSTKKKDAAIIAGSSAVGAAIGAIAGGGKGAAIGAGVAGGTGTGYVLATKGEPVAYGSEARFTFTLSDPLVLPVAPSTS